METTTKMITAHRRRIDLKMALLLALSVSLLALASCGNDKTIPSGSGFIEATQVTVSSEALGQIKSLRVYEGSTVTKGDTLAQIDTLSTMLRLRETEAAKNASEAQARSAAIAVEQASYALDLAGKEYERATTLVKSGATNRQNYDQVETAYKQALLSKKQADASHQSAQASLEQVKSGIALLTKQLGDCFPKAPVSGVVTDKYIEAGEWTAAGQPLVTIAKMDTVSVKIYLPAGDLTRISLGGRAQIDPEDGRNKPLAGSITWISEEAEFTPKNVQTKEARADLVYAVKVTIPNPGSVLKIGMPVSVKVQ